MKTLEDVQNIIKGYYGQKVKFGIFDPMQGMTVQEMTIKKSYINNTVNMVLVEFEESPVIVNAYVLVKVREDGSSFMIVELDDSIDENTPPVENTV